MSGDKLESRKVLSKGYLAYKYDERYFIIGTLKQEVSEGNIISYLYEFDPEAISKLPEMGVSIENNIFFPGTDLDYGYTQRHSKTPFFITMRTPDRRRPDIQELIARRGMEYYNQFEFLLRNEGFGFDNWRILKDFEGKEVINRDKWVNK